MATIGILSAIGGQKIAHADSLLVGAPSDVVSAYNNLVSAGHTPRVIQYDVVSTSWIILYDNNGYVGSGLPSSLTSSLNTVQSEGYPITNIAFTPTGGWVYFFGTDGCYAGNIPQSAYNYIVYTQELGYHLKSIAFAPNGAWVLLFGQNGCWYYTVDNAMANALKAAQNISTSIFTSVTYAPNGGWVLFYRVPAFTVGAYTSYSNYTAYENIPANLLTVLYGYSNSGNGQSSNPYIGNVPLYTLDFVPGATADNEYSLFYNVGTLP